MILFEKYGAPNNRKGQTLMSNKCTFLIASVLLALCLVVKYENHGLQSAKRVSKGEGNDKDSLPLTGREAANISFTVGKR